MPDAGITSLPLDHFKCGIVESFLERDTNDESCFVHQDQKLKYFCIDCKDLVCAECCLDDHAGHIAEKMEECLVRKLSVELTLSMENYQQNRDSIHANAVKSIEKYITVETEQKTFLEQKVDQTETQLMELKHTLKKANDGIEREQRRLNGIDSAINDYINISEEAIKDTMSTHRFLLKYSQAMKCHAIFSQREEITDDCEDKVCDTIQVEFESADVGKRSRASWSLTLLLVCLIVILGLLCHFQERLRPILWPIDNTLFDDNTNDYDDCNDLAPETDYPDNFEYQNITNLWTVYDNIMQYF